MPPPGAGSPSYTFALDPSGISGWFTGTAEFNGGTAAGTCGPGVPAYTEGFRALAGTEYIDLPDPGLTPFAADTIEVSLEVLVSSNVAWRCPCGGGCGFTSGAWDVTPYGAYSSYPPPTGTNTPIGGTQASTDPGAGEGVGWTLGVFAAGSFPAAYIGFNGNGNHIFVTVSLFVGIAGAPITPPPPPTVPLAPFTTPPPIPSPCGSFVLP